MADWTTGGKGDWSTSGSSGSLSKRREAEWDDRYGNLFEEEERQKEKDKARKQEQDRQRNEDKKKSEDKPWGESVLNFGMDIGKGIVGFGQRAATTAAQGVASVATAGAIGIYAAAGNKKGMEDEAKNYKKFMDDINKSQAVDGQPLSFISERVQKGKANVGEFGAGFTKAGVDTAGLFLPVAKGASVAKTVLTNGGIEAGLGTASDAADQYARTGKVDAKQALTSGAVSGLIGGTLSGVGARNAKKTVEKELAAVKENEHFTTFADGATARGETLKRYTEDIDRRMTEVDSPEYQKANGLTRSEEAQAKYDEIMAEPGKAPEVQAATQAVTEAEDTLKQYEVMRQGSPFARRADSIQNKIDNIEAARQKDLDNLETMANDPVDELNPEAFPELATQVNAKYDEMLAAENTRMEKLAAKSPEEFQEYQILKQTMEQVESTRMDAQTGLDSIMSKQEEVARKESEKLANEPNEEAIAQHKQFLEEKKAQLEGRMERAKQRYEAENKTVDNVDEELRNMKEGSHPLAVEGASRDVLFTRYKELTQERAKMKSYAVAETDPAIPKTQEEQTAILQTAIEEVGNTKVGGGAKLFRSFQQPANLLRNAGYEKLADMRTDSIMAYNAMAYDNKRAIKAWAKQAKHNSSEDMFNAANGDKAAMEKLTPGAQIVVEDWQKLRKDLGAKMGLPQELLERDFYIPHLFTDVSKQPKLIEIQTKIKNAQDEIDSGKLEGTDLKRKETHVKKLYDEINGLVDTDKVEVYQNFVTDKGDYSNRFLKKREGAEGYEKNFWKAIDSYMGAANTKINLEPTMQAMAKAKGLLDYPEKGMGKYLQGEIDKMRGTKADWDKAWDDGFKNIVEAVTNNKFSPERGATTGLRGFRHAMSLSHIGFSISSAVNTMAQVAVMPGSVNIDGAVYGMAQASALSAKLAKNTLHKTDIDDFTHMERMGVFEGSSNLIPEMAMNRYASKAQTWGNRFNKAAYSGITGADRYIRMSTYYGAKLKAEQQGLVGQKAERYIYERVNEVNQNFSKLETPHAFRSQVAKTLGSMITFAPGMIIRSSEIGVKSLKGGADIIGKVGSGKGITRAEFMKDVDDISKGLFTAMAVYGVGQGIGAVTGQEEVIPNPLSGSLYSSPALQFIFGNDSKTGLKGALTSQLGDEYDENGNNKTQAERFGQFWTEIIPAFTIPGFSQIKRSMDGKEANEKGFSETDTGRIRYQTEEDGAFDAQRLAFGQYSTPNGREYIKNIGRPGGASLSESESDMIREAPEDMQQQYYEFFRSADKVTGRAEASKKVTELFRNGEVEKARRTAEEFNSKVDDKMRSFYDKYEYVDPDLEDKMSSSIYITLTERSEKSRARSKE